MSENHDQRAVIPLLPWFENKIKTANKEFSDHLYLNNNQPAPLHPENVNALKQSIMPFSQDVFELME